MNKYTTIYLVPMKVKDTHYFSEDVENTYT